jgi:hypothetical protein
MDYILKMDGKDLELNLNKYFYIKILEIYFLLFQNELPKNDP